MTRALSWIVKLGIAAGILYFIFTIVPLSEVVTALTEADKAYVGLAFVVLAFERLAAGVRTKILSDRVGLGLSVYRICEISIVSSFYGMFVPGDLGGAAARWYKMSQPTGRRAQAVAAIGYDRVIDTVGLGMIGLVLWLVDVPRLTPIAIGLLFAGFSTVLLAAVGISLNRTTGALALRLLRHEGLPAGMSFVCDKLGKVLDSVQAFRGLGPGAVTALVVLTVVRHLLAIWIKYLFALSIGLSVPFVVLGWAQCLTNIATMIPLSYSGLGVREGTMVFLLRPYGVPGSGAVAISFLELIMTIVIAAAGGLFEIKNLFLAGRSSPVATSEPRDG
jgi:uncharacterized protein (TIRG00374 family)